MAVHGPMYSAFILQLVLHYYLWFNQVVSNIYSNKTTIPWLSVMKISYTNFAPAYAFKR